jgi:hypothetical protein
MVAGFALPRRWTADLWSKRSLAIEERLQSMEAALRVRGAIPQRGGEFDHWDLEVVGGLLGAARMFMAIEHHGDGRQLLRIRWSPRCAISGLALTTLFAVLSLDAAYDKCWPVALILGLAALLLVGRMLQECASATAAFLAAVQIIERDEKRDPPA